MPLRSIRTSIRRVPLVLVLLVAEHAARRFVIGIGMDRVQCQAIGQRRLMTADAALGQTEERRGLILPQFPQPAMPLGQIARRAFRRVQRADILRQHGQHDLVGVGRCNQVNGYFCFGCEILLPAPRSQAAKVGRIAGFQGSRFPGEILRRWAISRRKHRAAKQAADSPRRLNRSQRRNSISLAQLVCRTGKQHSIKFSMDHWAGKTTSSIRVVFRRCSGEFENLKYP